MILLVTPIARSNECAAALKEATGKSVVIAANLLEATTRLRAESFQAAVFDHQLLEREPQEFEIALAHLGAAIPVEVNLAISDAERLARSVQAILRHQIRAQAAALRATASALHGELNDTLTALLLRLDSAFEAFPEPAEKLRSVQAAAEKLRCRLELAMANIE